MEVILIQDVKELGFKGDVLKVKNGYARNYLIPQKFATMVTPRQKKILAENKKQQARKDRIELEKAQKLAAQIKEITVVIRAKLVDQNKNKIFGSISNSDIAAQLAESNLLIDKKYISIVGDSPKETGKYQATLRLHRDLILEFPFIVTGSKS